MPVTIDKVERNKNVSYYWDSEGGVKTLVEVTLTAKGDNDTLVTVTGINLRKGAFDFMKGTEPQ